MRKWLPRILLGLFVGIVLILIVLILLANPAEPHPYFTDGPPRPWVIAHQGGERIWPSDTLFAFQNAADIGADVLEMDMHMTADGVLVLMHDDTVDRTTDGSGAIKEKTLAEIKQLDAGHYWTADQGQTYPYRGQGITVPTLEEVFQAFPGKHLNIEIKQLEPSTAEPFCDLIREYEMQNYVLVASFHQQAMEEFRQVCPEVATSGTEDEIRTFFILNTAYLSSTLSPGYQAVQVPEYSSGLHVLTPHFVSGAHSRGLEVHPWTIDDPQDMQRFLDMGVDGIITDRPDLMLQLLNR